jgi:hypothetical protein
VGLIKNFRKLKNLSFENSGSFALYHIKIKNIKKYLKRNQYFGKNSWIKKINILLLILQEVKIFLIHIVIAY